MRLIDADALIEALRAKEYETVKHPTFLRSEFEEGFSRGINIAKEAIMIAPIANAEPVRRGKWIKKKSVVIGDYYECSLCNDVESRIAPGWWKAKNYCPNCGARLEVDE